MRVTGAEAEAAAVAALVAHGASASQAGPVARAMCLAEAEGNAVCGLFYLPHFCAQLAVGKIDGQAVAQVWADGAVVRVDAGAGFAQPAYEAGLPALLAAVAAQGIAAMAITRSGNALALGHFVRPLAGRGLIGLAMSNAPASVAPPGAVGKVFGTNPIAFAVPTGGLPVVVDQSLSAVTKTEVLMRAAEGRALEPGWAQDAGGLPTLEAGAALAGALLPAGGQKGTNLALLVEVLALLAGAQLSVDASGLGDTQGGPPGLGQMVLALDPARFAPGFAERMAALAGVFATAGARLPGAGYAPCEVLDLPDALWAKVQALAVAG